MSLYLIGLNYKQTPIELREQAAIIDKCLLDFYQQGLQLPEVTELFVISTCHRMEICVITEHIEPVWSLFTALTGMTDESLLSCRYVLSAEAVIAHLIRLASGLDSLVIGEPQVLGQFKQAIKHADSNKALGKELQCILPKVLTAAKKIRSQTDVGRHPVTLAYAVLYLAKRIFTDVKNCTALFIGAGETVELVLQYFIKHKISKIYVANRSLSKIQGLVAKYGVVAVGMQNIENIMLKADIVVTATSADLPVVSKEVMQPVLLSRGVDSIFIADLGLPRDVEAAVGDLNGVFLYNLDDLQQILQMSANDRLAAAQSAETLVDDYVKLCHQELCARKEEARICEFRNKIKVYQDQVLISALESLSKGKSPEDVVKQSLYKLAQKVMHEPTVKMRQISVADKSEKQESVDA